MKNNIPKLAKQSGKTVTELASLAGVSRSIMSQLVNSDEVPEKTRFDALEGVARALNVEMHDLFGKPVLAIKKIEDMHGLFSVTDNKTKKLIRTTGMLCVSFESIEQELWLAYLIDATGEKPQVHIEALNPTFELPVLNSLLQGKKIDVERTYNYALEHSTYLRRADLRAVFAQTVASTEFSHILDTVFPKDERPWGFSVHYDTLFQFQKRTDGTYMVWNNYDNNENRILFDAFYHLRRTDGEEGLAKISKEFQDISINALLDDFRNKGILPRKDVEDD